MKLYYAVSKGGQGRVFTSLPVREDHFGTWLGDSVGAISTVFMLFEADGLIQVPELKWSDDPVELELSLTFK